MVDNAIGLSGKGGNGMSVRAEIDHSIILSESYALGATNKTGTSPLIDYRVTNSILYGLSDSIFTSYNPADIHIYYSNLGEAWFGAGNNFGDPLFVNAAAHDYRPQSSSPCIDAGDPAAVVDPDGSRSDIGFWTFLPPPPVLGPAEIVSDGSLKFHLSAYPNRHYVVESSTNLRDWITLTNVAQNVDPTQVQDASPATLKRFYRARLAP